MPDDSLVRGIPKKLMRSFGISVGIAGLARLLRVLFPTHAWLFEAVALLATVVLATNLVFVFRDGLQAFAARLVHAEEGTYAGWSACTLALLSTFAVFAPLGASLWLLAVMLGIAFTALGVRDLWRSRQSIDPAHLSWFAWLGVAAATVPAPLAHLLPGLAQDLALAWFGSAAFVLVACWRRVLTHWSFRGARSPWFAPGAASGLAIWTLHQAPQPLLVPLLASLGVLGLVWFVPVLQLLVLRPAPRAFWPNLFPLTSIALFLADSHWTMTASALALWATVIAAIEVKNHVPGVMQQALRQFFPQPQEADQAAA